MGASSSISHSQQQRAIRDSGVPRSEVFILSKVSLGHADALVQMETILRDLETDHVDVLLIDWPTRGGTGLDPLCNPPVDERACRLSTWRALLQLHELGLAKSIGVSNWYPEHLQVRPYTSSFLLGRFVTP